MKLNSTSLVSDELLRSLQSDLAEANVCRFLIAYVSKSGLQTIGINLLADALLDRDSFGVSSLSCGCGYEPLITLSTTIAEKQGFPRLKYFMDPMAEAPEEPDHLVLFHSKLVYLVTKDRSKSVLYIGSHNWSRLALGPGKGEGNPRNAEITLRLEEEFDPNHITGTGGTVFADANQHLLNAYHSKTCLEAVPANEHVFAQWYQKGCKKARGEGLDEARVILAVLSDSKSMSANQWVSLKGQGIYVQILEENEGDQIWEGGDRVLVLIWDTVADLQNSKQPHILKCEISTAKAGPTSNRRGTNSSTTPISGFSAVIWDKAQHTALTKKKESTRRTTTTRVKQHVEFFDFDYPLSKNNSKELDGKVRPLYQFYLEIDQVVFPRDGELPEDPEFVWDPSSLAVAEKQFEPKIEKLPGFFLDEVRCQEMIATFKETFGVNLQKAKVLPFSGKISKRMGKKVVDHPLHDTFLNQVDGRTEDEFYSRAKEGELVPEIDQRVIGERRKKEAAEQGLFPESLGRTQRVFTMNLERLLEIWKEMAESIVNSPD